jgi:hypothetical protein
MGKLYVYVARNLKLNALNMFNAMILKHPKECAFRIATRNIKGTAFVGLLKKNVALKLLFA